MTLSRAISAAVLIAATCAGCSTPRPGPKRPQPVDVVPTQFVPSIGNFEDTNANGYPDSATISIYVFSDAYPEASILVPATLAFRLAARDGRVLREWSFDEHQTAALVRRGPVGPGYVLRLSLLDQGGTDVLSESRGDLVVIYRSKNGATLTSLPETVRIGKPGRLGG